MNDKKRTALELLREVAETIGLHGKTNLETIKDETGEVTFEADAFEVGNPIFIAPQNEGDEAIPAPDGDYKLEDGRMITVVENAIATITEAGTEEEEAPVEEVVEEETEATALTVESVQEMINLAIAEALKGLTLSSIETAEAVEPIQTSLTKPLPNVMTGAPKAAKERTLNNLTPEKKIFSTQDRAMRTIANFTNN